ncbi:SUMF1/EgtB/PvdO family nonheme iron enzyme [Streptomyces sp. SLBN-31]|uniref:formylglycine-generating enzyme family protein n=1 Tax=Streptomyces sp. SLBN-31 TaxID=2768444 RepID=UPI00114E6E31|nr:SUMF1/EgtB/PvdO family nonheme iron enzyme [Streptomyces sp. SLBN-31]TQJ92278.1 formylglycine-generating enzyme required for sulfatase activity [Streptomyces sp. SLBN-31]
MTTADTLAVNPNELDDRTAMGLPAAFTDRVDQDRLRRLTRTLAGKDPQELAARVADPRADRLLRLAAGQLLALLGDPRIDPLAPAMEDVPAARVRLGLAADRVDAVADAWRHVGVTRAWIAKEAPEYDADIAAFRIARYPVTNAEYRLFLTEHPDAGLPTSWRFGVYPAHLANHPVWSVSPQDADAYAAWLARRTGRAFRLPTEAEWEYAASGGDGRAYPWGEEPGEDLANTVEYGPLATTPVGMYPAGRSPFGAYDMAGNVEEYVADDYRPYPGGQYVDDDLHADTDAGYRVARGGSFTRYADLARCRRRHGWYRRDIYAMGFRLAETPPAPGVAAG